MADPEGQFDGALQGTQAHLTGFVGHGHLSAHLADAQADIHARITYQRTEQSLRAGAATNSRMDWAVAERDRAGLAAYFKTFYNPSLQIHLDAEAEIAHEIAFTVRQHLQAEVGGTADAVVGAVIWLNARVMGPVETHVAYAARLWLRAMAQDVQASAPAFSAADILHVADYGEATQVVALADAVAAELTPQASLTIEVDETLAAEVGDDARAAAHRVVDLLLEGRISALTKLSNEVMQGWVMNTEGDRPLSQYLNYDFNSFARIGDRYFAASDEGLYQLGGDTDDGERIDAHIKTMMLDFGTPLQKRVVSAYVGYTASGSLVLKVRSVDDGRLVEHWYKSKAVTADAPREGYKRLGMGAKSRYWQFELANVDGADFEITQVELHPMVLTRRV